MIRLSTIVKQFATITHQRYPLLPSQLKALSAWQICRTDQAPLMQLRCNDCEQPRYVPHSCGHRHCPHCQHHQSQQWLARQLQKQFPARYFMLTFTLPAELRSLVWQHQRVVYDQLMQCSWATLQQFSHNDKQLQGMPGATSVLHTHNRRLDYHPHVHMIVPGGGVDQKQGQWKTVNGKYLFNGVALAKVFKGKLLNAMQHAGFVLPATPKQWVAQCQHVGKGLAALKYLSRYLYRGVISNKNIISDDGTFVTFQYTDSNTKKIKTRRLKGEDFIHLILQHTLPKGFRRVRDYGFLHGNAKRVLKTLQWVLRVSLPILEKNKRPAFICPQCHALMSIVGFSKPKLQPG